MAAYIVKKKKKSLHSLRLHLIETSELEEKSLWTKFQAEIYATNLDISNHRLFDIYNSDTNVAFIVRKGSESKGQEIQFGISQMFLD